MVTLVLLVEVALLYLHSCYATGLGGGGAVCAVPLGYGGENHLSSVGCGGG